MKVFQVLALQLFLIIYPLFSQKRKRKREIGKAKEKQDTVAQAGSQAQIDEETTKKNIYIKL